MYPKIIQKIYISKKMYQCFKKELKLYKLLKYAIFLFRHFRIGQFYVIPIFKSLNALYYKL